MELSNTSRAFVLHEATLAQVRKLKPNLAVLPWGATEAHNYHLPHGTDVVEATAVAETAAEREPTRCPVHCVAMCSIREQQPAAVAGCDHHNAIRNPASGVV